MIVMIDNYDSFTYNLVQMLSELGGELSVYRNDAISVAEVEALAPDGLIVSPGPCTPTEAGISVELIRAMSGKLPLLGVCLGHQSIGAAFGGVIGHASSIMHGKVSDVLFDEGPMYAGMSQPFVAGRYHSLVIEPGSMPDELVADARTADGEIMGLHHASHPTYGVQFHPESVLTPEGGRLLENFLTIVKNWNPPGGKDDL